MIKLKVCGMRDPQNIYDVAALNPDYMGFIFYERSKRFIRTINPSELSQLPENIAKVGVFVNHDLIDVVQKAKMYDLNFIQLHGQESADYVAALKQQFLGTNIQLMKAFGIDDQFDFRDLEPYKDVVDYFLFDTQTPDHGGSGKIFDWKLLQNYTLDKPYFLSGGIGLESLEAIKSLTDKRLHAVDVNSRFETAPGNKDVNKLKDFKRSL
jgi:phosphoribosylanthranilate isomerase